MKKPGFKRKSWQEMLAERAEKKLKQIDQWNKEVSVVCPVKKDIEIVYFKDLNTGKTGGMKRSSLKKESDSQTAVDKRTIQAKLREGAILRDGGCLLRHFPEAGRCGGIRKDGELILQAEHLITRANSATYADLRNVICICRNHHIFFNLNIVFFIGDLLKKELARIAGGGSSWPKLTKVE
jgi:hypothetical protein